MRRIEALLRQDRPTWLIDERPRWRNDGTVTLNLRERHERTFVEAGTTDGRNQARARGRCPVASPAERSTAAPVAANCRRQHQYDVRAGRHHRIRAMMCGKRRQTFDCHHNLQAMTDPWSRCSVSPDTRVLAPSTSTSTTHNMALPWPNDVAGRSAIPTTRDRRGENIATRFQ